MIKVFQKAHLWLTTTVFCVAFFVPMFVFAAVGQNTAPGPTPQQVAPSTDATAVANLPADEYMLGKVENVGVAPGAVAGVKTNVTTYTVKLSSGKEQNKTVTIQENDLDVSAKNRSIRTGETVVIVKAYQVDGSVSYYLVDNYRIPALIIITLIFFAAAVYFGRKRGAMSLLGLVTTVAVIVWYIMPRIVAGSNPLTVSLIGTFLIAAFSLYLAHGFTARTSIAFVSTLITLGISAGVAVLFVSASRLFGLGSEDAFFLQSSGLEGIDLRGLLLGGIMLGVMGILDDITTAQAAVVDELKHANPALRFRELYTRGISVGREHIASLVNTLFLAYAGASLPLFLLFTLNKQQPLWFIINSETIAEEIIRTLVGSLCLILAVPITTALAALWYSEYKVSDEHLPVSSGHRH